MKSQVINEYLKKRSKIVRTKCRKAYNVMRWISGNQYMKHYTVKNLER